jgi:hypothetical protein
MPIRHRDTWVLPANAELTQFHGIMTVQVRRVWFRISLSASWRHLRVSYLSSVTGKALSSRVRAEGEWQWGRPEHPERLVLSLLGAELELA